MTIKALTQTTITPVEPQETPQTSAPVGVVKPTLSAPSMPTAQHVATVSGPQEVTAPQTVKGAVLATFMNDGYAGIAAQIKELKNLQMVARMGPEASAKLRAKIEVLEAMQGGAAGVQKELDAVLSTFAAGQAPAGIADKFDALVAVKNLFARFGALMERMRDARPTRETRAEIAVYEAIYGGAAAIESAIVEPELEIVRPPELQRELMLIGFGCEAVQGGKNGIALAKKELAQRTMAAMMTPEQAEHAADKRELLAFLEETFNKI